MAFPKPVRLSKNLEELDATLIAAGGSFSVVGGRNRRSGEFECYSAGLNLHGQLGTGQTSHIADLAKIDNLSNYQIRDEAGQLRQVEVQDLRCGLDHCLARLNVGAVMAWGGN